MDIKRGVVNHEDGGSCLEVAIKDLMIKHVAAYGTNKFTPKYHWLHDLKEQVLRDLIMLLDLFVIERCYLRVEGVADTIHNTTTWERSVLCGVTLAQKRTLENDLLEDGVVGPSRPLPHHPSVLVADHISFKGIRFHLR